MRGVENQFELHKEKPHFDHASLCCLLKQKAAVKRMVSQADQLHQCRQVHSLTEHHGRAVISSSLFQDQHRKATPSVTGRFPSHSGLTSTMMHWSVQTLSVNDGNSIFVIDAFLICSFMEFM